MNRYVATEKKRAVTGRKSDHVYRVVQAAGQGGASYVDIAAQAPVTPTSIYVYLSELRKQGFINVVDVPTTQSEKMHEKVEAVMQVGQSKWRCPTCGLWTRDEMAKQCKRCREKEESGA